MGFFVFQGENANIICPGLSLKSEKCDFWKNYAFSHLFCTNSYKKIKFHVFGASKLRRISIILASITIFVETTFVQFQKYLVWAKKRIFRHFFRPKWKKIGHFLNFLGRFGQIRLQKRVKKFLKFSQTIVDIINGMFCVSYQIIRNHKKCEGVLFPFDGYNFRFTFRYWPQAFGSLVQTRSQSQNCPVEAILRD